MNYFSKNVSRKKNISISIKFKACHLVLIFNYQMET